LELFNVNNRLTRLLNEDDWNWAIETMKPDTDPLAIGGRILGSKGRAAAWLGFMVTGTNQDLWRGIVERDAGFLNAVWDVAFGKAMKDIKIQLWLGTGWLRVVSTSAWHSSPEVPRWKEPNNPIRLNGDLLPKVGADWILTSDEQQRAARLSHLTRVTKPKPHS
jgi:hypothetical protein